MKKVNKWVQFLRCTGYKTDIIINIIKKEKKHAPLCSVLPTSRAPKGACLPFIGLPPLRQQDYGTLTKIFFTFLDTPCIQASIQ
jgi:hypothetical protein